MKYTQFNNTFAQVGAIGETEDIKEHCKSIVRSYGAQRKIQQPLIKWGIYKGCRRLKQDMEELHAIEIEHDGGLMHIYAAAELLDKEGYPFVGYETWSCTDKEPRWRFVLPLEKPLVFSELGGMEPVTAAHREFVNRLARVVGDGILSKESWYLGQCWYMGHQLGGRDPLMVSNL